MVVSITRRLIETV